MESKTDLQSFNQLFTNYKERFVRFAGTYVNNDMVAEDIAIEGVMYYWENRNNLAEDSNIHRN